MCYSISHNAQTRPMLQQNLRRRTLTRGGRRSRQVMVQNMLETRNFVGKYSLKSIKILFTIVKLLLMIHIQFKLLKPKINFNSSYFLIFWRLLFILEFFCLSNFKYLIVFSDNSKQITTRFFNINARNCMDRYISSHSQT